MLYFLIVWNGLLITVIAIGFYSLKRFKIDGLIPFHQQAILSIWLGMVLQSLLLLALGTVMPIGSMLLVFLGLIATIEIVYLIHQNKSVQPSANNASLLAFTKPIIERHGWSLLLGEIGVSILWTRPIDWFDTGLYHLGSTQWLAQYGLVPGLALINQKFGFISSWFAFSAPVTPQFIGNQIGATANGFLVVLSILTILLIFDYWMNDRIVAIEDLFLLIFLIALTLFYTVAWNIGEPIIISLSHDLAVNYSTGVFAWLLLAIAKINQETSNISHISITKSNQVNGINNHNLGFDISLLSVILAFCILSFKLTGLFLIPIAVLFFITREPFTWKRLGIAIITGAILILPLAIAQLKTSGCLLYPSQSFCIDLPWTLSTDAISSEAGSIRGGGLVLFSPDGLFSTFMNIWYAVSAAWQYSLKLKLAILLLGGLIGVIVWRVSHWQKIPPGELWLGMTGLGGSLFIFVVNQYVVFRFGGGIVLIFPLYLVTLLCHKVLLKFCLSPRDQQPFQHQLTREMGDSLKLENQEELILSSAFLSGPKFQRYYGLNLGLLFTVAALAFTHMPVIRNQLILPPALPTADLLHYQMNDVSYTMPSEWTVKCWHADLPCAPNPVPDLRLRDPKIGLKAGFVRTQPLPASILDDDQFTPTQIK
ncbi:MAG: hypothetical protein VKJ64_20800 [Leptolyngbyaceae bacterium]|nr:hypothetical protein [Leptolyngbyaceae bacterium]